MSEIRATISCCPFCGEEDLFPSEEHVGWECRSCLRVFSVKVFGLSNRRGPQ